MSSLPNCCNAIAYNTIAGLVRDIDRPSNLLDGALAIARHELPDFDATAVKKRLSNIAGAINGYVKGSQPQAKLSHLHDILFDIEQFRGNSSDYHNPANSLLPSVLDSKKGLPITLAMIYVLVGRDIGLDMCGIGLPGHFLAGARDDRGLLLVDCFDGGRILNRDQATQRMQETFGPEVEWSDEILRPVSNLHWLTRLIQNLLHAYSNANRMTDVAAMLELEMLLWPKQAHLKRDLGLVLARLGKSGPASQYLITYLQTCPEDPQRTDLQQLLEVLGA